MDFLESANWENTVKIISSGEVLWDIFGERELLGGAPLNFSASLQRLGHSVSLVTGVGMDERGERVIRRMNELGLSTDFVQRISGRDTGTATVSLDPEGHATYAIPRPAAFDSLAIDAGLLSRLGARQGDWLYFGTLAQTTASNLELVEKIFRGTPGIRGFYDMNLREGQWNLPLVQHLSTVATVVKLNDAEAKILSRLVYPSELFSLEDFCRKWSTRYELEVMCVTLGGEGCAIFAADSLRMFPGYSVHVVDTVGAGDAFAAGFLHAVSLPWDWDRRAAFANALGALVASRAGATPDWTIAECQQLIAEGHPSAVPAMNADASP